MDDATPQTRTVVVRAITPTTLGRIARGALTLAVLAGVVAIAPRWGADLRAVVPTIARLDAADCALLAAAAAVNIVTYWLLILAALPELGLRRAAIANQASTAVSNTALAGGAVSAGVTLAMYRSWGFTTRQFALAALASGVWTVLVKLTVPALAVALLVVAGRPDPVLFRSAALGTAIFVAGIALSGVLLSDARLAHALGGGLGRAVALVSRRDRIEAAATWGQRVVAVRADALHLLRRRRWPLTVTAVVSHVSLFGVLLLSLRLVGVSEAQLPWVHVVAAFAFIELLSALPVTPGALGVSELGYAALLAPGLPPHIAGQVVAAVLVYRALTYLPPIPIGAACYLWWRRRPT